MSSKPAPQTERVTRASARNQNIAVTAEPPLKTPSRPTRATKTATTERQVSKTSQRTASGKAREITPPLKKNLDAARPSKATKLSGSKGAVTAGIAPLRRSEHDGEKEVIKAYLRIRPNLGPEQQTGTPYLNALSTTTVEMVDHNAAGGFRYRATPAQTQYTFSHVFPADTQQGEFFAKTTLPLIQDVLGGYSGLLFAYGVSNSGKTYTIQGGSEQGSAGILPRTLDVIFNSVKDLQTERSIRPVGLSTVEDEDEDATLTESPRHASKSFGEDADLLSSMLAEEVHSADFDDTALEVDTDFEYSIWVSFAEIYNDKIFDLLSDSELGDTVQTKNNQGLAAPLNTGTRRSPFSSSTNIANLASFPSNSDMGDPFTLKRRALALKGGSGAGKYIAGLREIRVRTSAEARNVVKMGHVNRRVFGTLANHASSRSHGIFTIKVLKFRKGSTQQESVQLSRLSIVDLAGSERTKNTQTTGERLKEAGNINKSLMVLGQCMEVLRSNQKKTVARTGATGIRTPKLALVPYRHSKLTELFQDYFEGHGKVVMIVNVNPYDTGFDENSHVMKFSALAREITTTAKRMPLHHTSNANLNDAKKPVQPRTVKISVGGLNGRKLHETQLQIVEEDSDKEEEDLDDPLVDALFEEIESLRRRLFEAETRAAVIEAEVREEVMKEIEVRMHDMERRFATRLLDEAEHQERKTDRKIDLLYKAGQFGHSVGTSEDEDDEDDDETSSQVTKQMTEGDDESDEETSPIAPIVFKIQRPSADHSEDLGLFDHDEQSAEETDSQIDTEIETDSEPEDAATVNEDEESLDDNDDDDNWEEEQDEQSSPDSRRTSSATVYDELEVCTPRKKSSNVWVELATPRERTGHAKTGVLMTNHPEV
ncbi:kinesin-domain-containing protein [Sistotremastrum suecicum HHB10207 ss-3]|uniref:Kinesin-like protein n=1 Tax=Sistotremastrum suecicum HHB10207 ss-3 TaxID=1314776 RepID=A0A166J977_9AGAM|nr:kinesin-domain-containing protein [Sistotremastrum suecicum HHB10207 ss-3]